MKTTGEQLKTQGIGRISENNKDWLASADTAIWFLLRIKSEFTAEDLRAITIKPPHQNCIGAAFNIASKAGIIKRVGYRKSTSPSAHGRVVSVWAKA